MNPITILGLVAACCTTISFLPQAIKVIKTKDTSGISLYMYIIFTTGVFLWLIYGYLVQDIPLMVCNLITFLLASVILILKIRYK